MDVPPQLRDAAGSQDEITVTTRSYDDESVISVDFGPAAGQPSLDVVGDTAIVVVGDSQFEFEIPNDADDVAVNDGILTIRAESAEG